MVCLAYVVLLAFIYFGLGINVPVYSIIDAAAHPDLVAMLDDLALLGFLVAAFHPVIILLAAILRGFLNLTTSMIATLLGKDGFRKGMDLYFARHDGAAVTTDDFVACMADANGRDLSQFKHWYSQAGTPELAVTIDHDADAATATVTVTQSLAPTPGQPDKETLHIPLALGLLSPAGDDLPLRLAGEEAAAPAPTPPVPAASSAHADAAPTPADDVAACHWALQRHERTRAVSLLNRYISFASARESPYATETVDKTADEHILSKALTPSELAELRHLLASIVRRLWAAGLSPLGSCACLYQGWPLSRFKEAGFETAGPHLLPPRPDCAPPGLHPASHPDCTPRHATPHSCSPIPRCPRAVHLFKIRP